MKIINNTDIQELDIKKFEELLKDIIKNDANYINNIYIETNKNFGIRIKSLNTNVTYTNNKDNICVGKTINNDIILNIDDIFKYFNNNLISHKIILLVLHEIGHVICRNKYSKLINTILSNRYNDKAKDKSNDDILLSNAAIYIDEYYATLYSIELLNKFYNNININDILINNIILLQPVQWMYNFAYITYYKYINIKLSDNIIKILFDNNNHIIDLYNGDFNDFICDIYDICDALINSYNINDNDKLIEVAKILHTVFHGTYK